jgi:SAM-dependent MidA family methyltransferase
VAGSPELAAALRYAPIELNRHRLGELVAGIGADGSAAALELDLGPDVPETGLVIANELLDALPVHRVIGRTAGLAELFVTWRGDRFEETGGPPSTPALADRLAADRVELPDGARAEICLEIDGWLAEASAGLARGAVIIIDYGHPAAELYGPTRRDGTLMAYAQHGVHDDWSVAVGQQDLTAHVDFSAVERAAGALGLTTLGLTRQAEFLVGVGLDRLLETVRSDPGTTVEAWLSVRAAVQRMLDPRASGGFRVLILGRGLPADPPLAGLAYRLGAGR